jgi:outer membrane protein assembly factor BamB
VPSFHVERSSPFVVSVRQRFRGVQVSSPPENLRSGWAFETTLDAVAPPAVGDDTVYFASSLPGGIVAVGTGGEKQWWFDSTGGYVYGPTVAEGTVYYSTVIDTFGKNEQGPWFVYAVNTDDGTKRWRFRKPQGTAGLPAVANGTVYVGSTDGHVYGFDAGDESREWRVTLDVPISQGIAVTEATEIIYAGTDAGTLFVLKPRSVIDRVSLSVPVATPPAVRGENVIVGTQDGRVHSLAAKNNHTMTQAGSGNRSFQHER